MNYDNMDYNDYSGYASVNYAACPHCGRRVGYTQNLCDHCRSQYAPKTPSIDVQIDAAWARAQELQAKKEAMAKFGSDEDYGNDDAILFKRQFKKSSKVYTYVAVKTPIGWFITGTNSTTISFATLVEGYLLPATEVWVCKEWGQI